MQMTIDNYSQVPITSLCLPSGCVVISAPLVKFINLDISLGILTMMELPEYEIFVLADKPQSPSCLAFLSIASDELSVKYTSLHFVHFSASNLPRLIVPILNVSSVFFILELHIGHFMSSPLPGYHLSLRRWRLGTFSKSLMLSVSKAAFMSSACCAMRASLIRSFFSALRDIAFLTVSTDRDTKSVNSESSILRVLSKAFCHPMNDLSIWYVSDTMMQLMRIPW